MSSFSYHSTRIVTDLSQSLPTAEVPYLEKKRQSIEDHVTTGQRANYAEAFRLLTEIREKEKLSAYPSEGVWLEISQRRDFAEALEALIDKVRCVARCLQEDERNEHLASCFRLVSENYIEKALCALRANDLNESATRADLALVLINDLSRAVFGEYRQPLEERKCFGIDPIVYSGGYEIITGPDGNSIKNYDLKIPWLERKSILEAISNLAPDAVREFLLAGVVPNYYCELWLEATGKAPEPADPFHFLSNLRLEMCFAARRLCPDQREESSTPNAIFARKLYRIDFEIEKAFGGGLLGVLEEMLKVERKRPQPSAEETLESFGQVIKKLEDLLTGSLADKLFPVRNSEEARVNLPYSLRTLKYYLSKVKEQFNFS